jgi:hypothetical protein
MKKSLYLAETFYILSRNDRIRTCDPYHPKVVRYRAALRSVIVIQIYKKESDFPTKELL